MSRLPDENQTTIPGYYMRYGAQAGVKALLFRTTRAMQVRELNEMQESIHDRINGIANAIFSDGDVTDGLELVRLFEDEDGYNVQIGAGGVFIQGDVVQLEAIKLTIPLDMKVAIGLRMVESVIDDADNNELRDPAQGTANFDNPGASRLVRTLAWGWVAEDESTDGGEGTFFPVYTVDSGVPVLRNPPPAFDAIVEHVAKYDYDAHKNYAVRGLEVSYMTKISGSHHFNVSEGVGNIRGLKRERLASTRLVYAQNPTTKEVNNEPHVFTADGDGNCKVPLNRFPLNAYGEIFGTKLKTETVTRGAFVGGKDQLVEPSVLQVLEVKQGGTTYVAGTDFNLDGDDIDWSPLGTEPAPGSTYTVKYHYQATVEPIATDDTSITLGGLVTGTYVNIDYSYKLPRVDFITMDEEGLLHRIQGVSLERNPQPKQIPLGHLPLATILFDWMNDPVVTDERHLSVPMSELHLMKKQMATLFDAIAVERLRVDMSLSDPAAKHGIFVDPFNDDDLRDLGTAQTAAIVDNELTLPFQATIHSPSDATATGRVNMLPFVEEAVIEQPNKTACMKINPYQAFDPIPARVRLSPAVDRWVQAGPDEFVSQIATRFIKRGHGSRRKVFRVTTFEQVGLRQIPTQFMRQRNVGFAIDNFGPTETLNVIKFDGINVTHSVNVGNYVANSSGHLEGQFQVPANVQTGTKTVEFNGSGGSFASVPYTAQGTIAIRIMQQVNTTIVKKYDPLAQTFTLDEDRIITGLQLKFCLLGDLTKPVFIQIRETQVGIPTMDVLAEGSVAMNSVTLNQWKNIPFDFPVHLTAGREYSIVVLTDDANHSLAIARLGDYVTSGNGKEGWVTSQPYQIGTLLASSNGSTWLPIQESDLAFKLMAAKFTATTSTIDLGDINGVNVTDMVPLATVVRPSADTLLDMIVEESTSGAVYRTPEDRPLQLADRITDTFNISIELNGTSKLSPIVYPWMQVLTGNMQGSGTYYGRNFKAASTFNATVTFSVLKTGSANCVPYMASQKLSMGVPVITEGVYEREFLPMTLVRQEEVGDGWVEETYTITGAKGVGLDLLTQVHLALTGTPKFRVYVTDLRAITK